MQISRQKTKEKDQLSKNKKIEIAMELNIEPGKYNKFKISKLIMPILLMLFFLCSSNVLAANHYILDGGTGNGSAWNNALDSLPSTLVRGDTYYIGDGTYGSYAFDDTESGSTYIYIKKATEADHGTDTGWNSAYGDGQAVFTSSNNTILKFSRGYYEFDGNHSPSSGMATEWGFKLLGQNVAYLQWLVQMDKGGETGSLEYVKIINTHIDASPNTEGGSKCIKGKHGGTPNGHITVSHCKLENFGDAISIDGDPANNIFEYNYFHRTPDDGSGDHGDAIVLASQDNVIIRFNQFNWNGQQIFFSGYADWHYDNVQVYGNVFYCDETPYVSCSSLHQNSDGPSITNLKVYNNTFYNVYYAIHARKASTMYGDFRNNVVYDVTSDNAFLNGITHDYNYYKTGTSVSETHIQTGGNPFTNSDSYDLTLDIATNAGDTAIGATYETDMFGNTRGADGIWDRGAYEKTWVSAPSNLRKAQ